VVERLDLNKKKVDGSDNIELSMSSVLNISRFNQDSMGDRIKIYLTKFNQNVLIKHVILDRKKLKQDSSPISKDNHLEIQEEHHSLETGIKGRSSYEDEENEKYSQDTEAHDIKSSPSKQIELFGNKVSTRNMNSIEKDNNLNDLDNNYQTEEDEHSN
jgi:hypothetical protein